MAQPYIEDLVKSLIEQGCRVRKTRAGYFVFCPDGVSTLGFHASNHSDKRAMRNLRADVRRAGLEWPKGIPA